MLRSSRIAALAVLVVLLLAACVSPASRSDDTTGAEGANGEALPDDAGTDAEDAPQDAAPEPADDSAPDEEIPVVERPDFGDPPPVPDGPLADDVRVRLDAVVDNPALFDLSTVEALRDVEDPRILWLLSDLLRFPFVVGDHTVVASVASDVSGVDFTTEEFAWGPLTDHLIAWDLPAYDGYVQHKAALFTHVEPGWQPFFDDAESDIDWRIVSWGGVLIDNRELGDTERCLQGCIPSLDFPALTPASEGDWYPDDALVFGVEIGGEAIAFPKNIMEVHEMVNMTIGGRQVAIPYCTLCASAQVFFTDEEGGGTGDIVMRTSGLLSRSNKVMYDLTTQSVFNTFTGAAVSGPLREQGVVLEQATVVTSTWAAWREANPDTQIVAEDGGIGRRYDLDPLRGRDDNGPIFPIGDVDPRLPVQSHVLGVELEDGTTIAFPVIDARATLLAGEAVQMEGVNVEIEATGLVADIDGEQIPSHQAFWFAWSQFYPDTLLWQAP